MAGFSPPGLARDQRIFIPSTLDDVIPDAHPVRILDEIFAQVDWKPWEVGPGQKREPVSVRRQVPEGDRRMMGAESGPARRGVV